MFQKKRIKNIRGYLLNENELYNNKFNTYILERYLYIWKITIILYFKS